jgi:hypothetical protein
MTSPHHEAIRRVQSDLRIEEQLDEFSLRLRPADPSEVSTGGSSTCEVRRGDVRLATIKIAAALGADDLAALVADSVQNVVAEYSSEPWPACPAHAHPLIAEVQDEVAVWLCPDTDSIVCEVGRADTIAQRRA